MATDPYAGFADLDDGMPAPAAPRDVILGPPRLPPPQTADQARKDELDVLKAERDLSKPPAGDNKAFDMASKLRDDFQKAKEVQNYASAVPVVASAMRAADNAAGDLQTIYAFGKVMDPGSVVREGELQMAGDTAPLMAAAERYGLRFIKGNRLRPEDRKRLIEEMRVRASEYGSAYSQTRFRYSDIARRAGLDPIDVIGPHAGEPFQGAEADYLGRPIRNRDGTQGAAPRIRTATNPQTGEKARYVNGKWESLR